MIFHCKKFSLDILIAVVAARVAQLEVLRKDYYSLDVSKNIWDEIVNDKNINLYFRKVDNENGILDLSEFQLPEQVIVRLDSRDQGDWCYGTCMSGDYSEFQVGLLIPKN